MTDANESISLPSILTLLKRHWIVIALTVLVAVGISLVISARADVKYDAKASISFNDNSSDLQALGVAASPDFQPDKAAAAQAERITRPDVIASVKQNLRLNLSDSAIQKAITTQVDPASNLVTISAQASTGQLAARMANGFAAAIRTDQTDVTRKRYESVASDARARARKLKGVNNAARRAVYEDQAARLLALANFVQPVDVVRTAEVPGAPSSPKPVRNALLAGLLGLILGVALSFARQALDRRLREQSDVQQHIDSPIIGFLRRSTLGKSPLASDGDAQTAGEDTEAFRILRMNTEFLSNGTPPTSVLVSSPLPEEGKSTAASGLAWAEALAGKRTLLVDCDLRRPTVATRLGIDPTPGLAEFLQGKATPADILRVVKLDDDTELVVIPAGQASNNHAELLQSARFRDFLGQVAGVYDRVVLDTAPLLPVGDTLALLPQVDTVLLCLRLGQTTRDDALAARAALAHLPDKPLGIVLTAADKGQKPYYVGSYAYGTQATEKV